MKKKNKSPNKNAPPHPEWDNLEKKREAFNKVMDEILKSGSETYTDDMARAAFKQHIKVPDKVRIIILPPGDTDTEGGGSAIIQLPSKGTTSLSDEKKLELFVCTYNIW